MNSSYVQRTFAVSRFAVMALAAVVFMFAAGCGGDNGDNGGSNNPGGGGGGGGGGIDGERMKTGLVLGEGEAWRALLSYGDREPSDLALVYRQNGDIFRITYYSNTDVWSCYNASPIIWSPSGENQIQWSINNQKMTEYNYSISGDTLILQGIYNASHGAVEDDPQTYIRVKGITGGCKF